MNEQRRQSSQGAGAGGYVGRAVYIYAYDVAYDMARLPDGELLGRAVERFEIGPTKRGPREFFFYRPQLVRLPPLECPTPDDTVEVGRQVKLFGVGAVSVTLSVPFRVDAVEQLAGWHAGRVGELSLNVEARRLATAVRDELADITIRPVAELGEAEPYVAFCIHTPLPGRQTAERWFTDNRLAVAGALTEESEPDALSQQEAEESTRLHLSYYGDDLAVVDWDAAVLVDRAGGFDEALHVMELAKVQLAELAAYDRILDDAIVRAYRDMKVRERGRAKVRAELHEIRIDLARLSDELSNITKFFGDWHVARVYQRVAKRLHLTDWHRTIDDKLKTLDGLYQLLRTDQTNRWMIILEATIVALFIIEVILLLFLEL